MHSYTRWGRSLVRLGSVGLGALICLGALDPSTAAASEHSRYLKRYLVTRPAANPQIVIYGGSRSQRAEPSYLQDLTGITGFNAGASCSQPTDVLAFSSFLHARNPGQRQFPLWYLSIEVFRKRDLFFYELLTMPDMMAQIPSEFKAGIKPRPPLSWHPPSSLKYPDGTEWRPDGSLKVSHYDLALAGGAQRDDLVADRAQQFVTNYNDFTRLLPNEKRVFETTLARWNRWQWIPVILLPPYSDELLPVLKAHGWDARHRETLAYLADLHETYRFVVIDFSNVDAFGGNSDDLLDGIHCNTRLSRLMLKKVVEKAGAAFDPSVPYERPHR